MKKALALLLSVLLILGLAACSGTPETPDSSTPATSAPTTVTTDAADPTDPADPTTDGSDETTDPAAPTDPTVGGDETDPTTVNGTTATVKPGETTKPNTTTKVTTTKKTTTTKKKLTADEIYKNLKRSERDCEEFELDKYMQNLWTENVTYNETFLPMLNKDGTMDPIQLMYPADKVLAVHDSSCNYTYFEGKDFTVENGCIVLTADSKIKPMKWDEYFVERNTGFTSVEDGRYLHFGEGATFHSRQYVVSYIHTDTWTDMATMPENKANLLPKTLKKLKNKENINIVLTGDSISCGGNNSLSLGLGPHAPGWDKILIQYWEDAFKTKINFTNIAEGGSVSSRGVELIPQTNALNPDLVIIGFGMNDSTWMVSVDSYIEHIQAIIDGVRAQNPNCEFIVMSSMLSNPLESPNRGELIDDYREAMYEQLEGEGIAVANVTASHAGVLTRKEYADMTGNNINHPNDFLNRIYAQTVGFLLTDEGI